MLIVMKIISGGRVQEDQDQYLVGIFSNVYLIIIIMIFVYIIVDITFTLNVYLLFEYVV